MSDDFRLTHIGLCVHDVGRSADFYCAALGFTEVGRMTVDDAASERLLEVPGLVLELVYLDRDGFRLELLGYHAPGVIETPTPRAMNSAGFTHLSFRVGDVEAFADAVVAGGGGIVADRTVVFAGGNRGMMLTDPDGNLIELIERLSK